MPYCGKQEFIKGVQTHQASVCPTILSVNFQFQYLYHIICLNCGAAVKSYVKNLNKIATKIIGYNLKT